MCTTCFTGATTWFSALQNVSAYVGQFCNPKFFTRILFTNIRQLQHIAANHFDIRGKEEILSSHGVNRDHFSFGIVMAVKHEALNMKPCALIAGAQSSPLSHFQLQNKQ